MLHVADVLIALLAAAPTPSPFADVPLPPPPAAVTTPPPATAPAKPAPPATPQRRIRLVATLGLDLGFTDLLEVELDDGSSRSITANQGAVVAIGVAVPYLGGRLETQATVGLKYSGLHASNGSASLMVFPLEALQLVNVGPLRLGGGVVYLPRPSMSGDGVLSEFDADFESSLGIVLQGEWVYPFRDGSGRFTIGPRFIWQKLQLTGGGPVIDANAVGAVLGFSTL